MVTKVASPSAPPQPGLRQRRREQTAEKIFLTAMDLFSRKGFAQTTVEEITRGADVGKGTFFNYFPSKEHVLGFLIARQKGVVAAHLQLAREGNTPVPEVLKQLGSSLTRFPGKSPAMARCLIAAFLASEEVRTKVAGEMKLGRRWLAEIIRLGQQRGQLRGDVAPAELAHDFHRALIGTVLLWALDPSSPLEKHMQQIVAMVVAAASPVAPRAAARRRKGA